MLADEKPLIDLAGAVADGTPIDWGEAESTADATLQVVIEQLRIVAGLASVHRHLAEDQAAAGHEPVEPPASRWGPLELRREIGSGGFGTVYLAWDPGLEREVALKILRDSKGAAAVIQEARMLARVRHPNVVNVYGVDEHDGAVGLWMECIEGATLRQHLVAHGVFTPRDAALIGVDVCRALAAVHRAGLLHRDIKSQNVMREAATGRVVLMDFGAGERRDQARLWGRLTGTPQYLAPELLRGEHATIASDLYSLGVLLYHLVTRRFPFEADNINALEVAHARGESTPLRDLLPSAPPAFARVIEHATDRDPAKRYRSAGEMQADLHAIAFELEPSSADILTGAAPIQASQTPSIAVLPFENLGPEQDLEYFCNGLAEELLTGLGKVKGLRVASRTSSMHFKNSTTDIKSICRQLNVGAVLEGTVRKAGDRLRITAQLVSAEDGCHLWSEGYDQSMDDVVAVQDQIAQSVVDRLKITLGEIPRRPLIRRQTENPRAYELYLKGRFYYLRRYQGGLMSALSCFDKALEEDAGYALPHAGRADALVFLGFYLLQPPRAVFGRAREAVERALSIDPDLPEAHVSLALIKLGDEWDFAEAKREFTHALELDPNHALARIYLSWLLVLLGDSAGAAVLGRSAQELEPMSSVIHTGAGYGLFLAKRYDEAVVQCEKALEIDPDSIIAIYVIGMCRAQQSRLPEAIMLMDRAVTMSSRMPFYLALLGNFYGRAGETAKAHELLAELERVSTDRYVPPHSAAYIYAGLGDIDRAIEWERKAYDDGAGPFTYFSPVLENLHSDPRHVAELRRMGYQS